MYKNGTRVFVSERMRNRWVPFNLFFTRIRNTLHDDKRGKCNSNDAIVSQQPNSLHVHILQGRALPNFCTRNSNQWVLKGNFRTTKSKPICINGIIRNQNRNQFLIYKKFEITIKTKMQKAVLFKTKTETNIRSYLVTMTS